MEKCCMRVKEICADKQKEEEKSRDICQSQPTDSHLLRFPNPHPLELGRWAWLGSIQPALDSDPTRNRGKIFCSLKKEFSFIPYLDFFFVFIVFFFVLFTTFAFAFTIPLHRGDNSNLFRPVRKADNIFVKNLSKIIKYFYVFQLYQTWGNSSLSSSLVPSSWGPLSDIYLATPSPMRSLLAQQTKRLLGIWEFEQEEGDDGCVYSTW